MLTTKSKIKESKLTLYERISTLHQEDAAAVAAQLIEDNLYHQTVTVVYSILINHSVPIATKFNALTLVRWAFQTARPFVIDETERILPVLIDIARFRKHPPIEDYFAYREHRCDSNVTLSEQYVKLCRQLLKYWSECLADVGHPSTAYQQAQTHLEKHYRVRAPHHFTCFTFADYLQFINRWTILSRRELDFEERLDIYRLLSDEEVYNDRLQTFKSGLSAYAEEIVGQAYALLISHSAPVEAKMLAVKALRELYIENNGIFCSRADSILLPYFEYVVRRLEHDRTLLSRFLQKVEKRSDIEQNNSALYVTAVLTLIVELDCYRRISSTNPYRAMTEIIISKGWLKGYLHHDVELQQRFEANRKIGKHRLHEYRKEQADVSADRDDDPASKEIESLKSIVKESKRRQLELGDTIRELKAELDQLRLKQTQRPSLIFEGEQPTILDTENKSTYRSSFGHPDQANKPQRTTMPPQPDQTPTSLKQTTSSQFS